MPCDAKHFPLASPATWFITSQLTTLPAIRMARFGMGTNHPPRVVKIGLYFANLNSIIVR